MKVGKIVKIAENPFLVILEGNEPQAAVRADSILAIAKAQDIKGTIITLADNLEKIIIEDSMADVIQKLSSNIPNPDITPPTYDELE